VGNFAGEDAEANCHLWLRLSPQSRFDRKAKSLSAPSANDPRRPWQDVDGELDD
jgi:hypothetical protein